MENEKLDENPMTEEEERDYLEKMEKLLGGACGGCEGCDVEGE